MNKLTKRVLLLSAIVMLAAGAEAQMARFQALFLYQFAKNTSWPQSDDGRTFVFAVVSDPGVATELRQYVGTRTVAGRRIEVQEATNTSDLGAADIIYLGKSKNHLVSTVVKENGDRKVLIVSGSGGMCQSGAAISFVGEGGKLNYEICEHNIARNGLRVTPKLLSLGKKVK